MGSIAIIGGGPAGYVAAITAAQQGQEVTIIDQGPLGGTCLNEGCMPTKSLLESAEVYSQLYHANKFGIRLPSGLIEIDWNAVQDRKNRIVSTLVQGIQYLMKKNKVKVIKGTASFKTSQVLQVVSNGNQQEMKADNIIIAAGSEPAPLPFAPFDGEWVIHSGQAMSLQSIPSSLLIVGGGVIGCEFASIFSRMGTKVTIVEMAGQLLPGEDEDIARVLHKQLEEDGAAIYTSAALKHLEAARKKAFIEDDKGLHEIQADRVLVSVGRKPRVNHLGLEGAGVDFSNQGIHVNDHMQTNIPSIYACGDVVGGIQLAHMAFHEGKVAALNACGMDAVVHASAVPRCIYTSPEIASVGLTEKQAREKYGDIRMGEFPFSANGKALIANEQAGKVKVMIDPEFGEIVGISIVGAHATELIGQGAVMLHAELTADLMENFIAAHPTLSEAVHEALLSAVGHAVHV
ncbi:dihydrolipoyl dehydrogenase [Cytobacillus oceanisediminis]|uniref:Dihydrolipoyl dehydrogenase n=1 Tax=Cytobacillus oceanisediminis 2691 TaxID=1196031 RepID=A0A160MCH8_9BACI|nr:dihydrolipoyl dehydrogenase [Cytobacillus oceanisediminis]AND40632.1 dihydrolipoyl dehydrogenase [Cytobacillus oceanisediminis 2691]MCM3401106.1 dihydrolipoyl dehydrogenase [Cytobacillus oceanisediminis]